MRPLFLILVLLLFSCGKKEEQVKAEKNKLEVLCSFSILEDWLKEIGGDKISVTSLVGAEEDSHHYSAKPRDMKQVEEADLIYCVGIGFDKWLDKLHEASSQEAEIHFLAAGLEGLRQVKIQHGDHFHNHADPHVWHDLVQVQKMIQRIADSLSEKDAANTTYYQANAKSYIAELKVLEEWTKTEVAKIPVEKRRIITSHDALGYFIDRYDFKVDALVHCSLETNAIESSAGEVKALLETIKKNDSQCIFVEKLGSDRLTRQIAKEAKIPFIGEIYTGALGKKGSEGDTYIKMMRHNVQEILKGLQ